MQAICMQLAMQETFEHLSLTGGDPQKWILLEEFLAWFLEREFPFDLQISTALTQDIAESELWRDAISDVRVSLDAATNSTYLKIRGDRNTNPKGVLKRIRKLGHPNLSTLTTVFPENIHEMFEIAAHLDDLLHSGTPIRKVMFLPVLGPRAKEQEKEFWDKWNEESCRIKEVLPFLNTSFADKTSEVRDFCESPEAADIPCTIGNSFFHIKANGDYYPCCLVGGEALPSQEKYRLGNWFRDSNLQELAGRFLPTCHYHEGSPCPAICQYKQLAMNLAVHEASKQKVAMP